MKFEHISILKGKLAEKEKNEEIQNFKNYFTNNGITISEFEDIGLKKLAYDIQNNKEGIYIRFVLDTKTANIPDFEKWLRENDNVLKFITIKMEETLEQHKANIYDQIKQLGESNLFNAVAEEVIYQLENNNPNNLEINLENVKDIADKVLEDDYFNENMNNCIRYAIDSKIREHEETIEQDEEDSI